MQLTRLRPSIGTVPTTSHGQWFRGRQTPENIPVPPPNDPRYLPPPSQFVPLASATVHPRLAIPPTGRSNNRFIRLAAAFPPQPAALQTSHPFSVSAFLTEPSYYRPRSDPFHRDRTTLPHPPFNATGFYGAHPSRPPPLPPRRTCRTPHALLHPDVLPQSRLAPVSAGYLEEATALLLTVWLVLLSTNVGAATAPFSRLPWPKLSRQYQATKGISRPTFQFTHQRTQANDEFSVFPQPQQTRDLSLPTQLFTYPPINRILATNGPSAFLDDTTTDDFPNHGSPVLARRCFRLHRLSHIHLGSSPRRSIPQWVIFFFLAVRVLLIQPSTDSVSFASEHRTVPLQPNGRESPSDTNTAAPLCLNNPVGLPPKPRQPLPVP